MVLLKCALSESPWLLLHEPHRALASTHSSITADECRDALLECRGERGAGNECQQRVLVLVADQCDEAAAECGRSQLEIWQRVVLGAVFMDSNLPNRFHTAMCCEEISSGSHRARAYASQSKLQYHGWGSDK